jgi:hypothetical protein
VGINTKDEATRITETLTTISTNTLVPANERARVHTFAQSYMNTTYPNTNSGAYKSFSNGMTMTDVNAPGNKPQRALRRAIFLLWSAMGEPMEAAQAKAILVANVQDAYISTMQKALCFADTNNGNTAGTQYVLETIFRGNPLVFLQKNKILILGSSAFNAAADTNILRFSFHFEATRNRYEFWRVDTTAADPVGRYCFNTTSVPAIYWGDVPGRTTNVANGSFAAIRGTRLSGTSMLTTQFTGCAFCLKDNGQLYAAHVSPGYKGEARDVATPGIDATVMAQQLANQVATVAGGDFSNAAGAQPFRVFGKSYSNIPGHGAGYDALCTTGGGVYWMSLFGFRNGGIWRIYGQEIVNREINDAYQIW